MKREVFCVPYTEATASVKTNVFENADLYIMNWRKRYFDALSCYFARYTFIWRTGEHK